MTELQTIIPTKTEINVDIECPNCQMLVPHEYTEQTYSRVYSECSFCKTKFRWSKEECIEIVSATQKKYIIAMLQIPE